MKFTKMSLVAALLVGSSAFALDNVKVSGDAKLYYETVGSTTKANANAKTNVHGGNTITANSKSTTDFGDRKGGNAQAALNLGVTADLVKNISAGVSLTVTDTLGLENNLVGGTWAGPLTNAGLGRGNTGATTGSAFAATTQWWVSEAWVAGTMGKTTAKVGRQYIDTPLAFTETWTIAKNSFSAAVLINQDLPDTTLVGAYVGQSNGASGGKTVANAGNADSPFTGYTTYNNSLAALGADPHTNAGGLGAYAAGLINNSIKPLTFQAWYYDVQEVAKAYWLQADVKVGGLMLGAQYAVMNPEDNIRLDSSNKAPASNVAALGLKDSKAYALMVGYEIKDIATLKAAYSKTDDQGLLNIQNTATGTQSKLYTEAWWNYGYVGMPGTTSYMLAAEGDVKDMFSWFAQYTSISVEPNDQMVSAAAAAAKSFGTDKVNEFTLGANKSFGPLDVALAYVNTSKDKATSATKDSWVGMIDNNGGDYTDNRLQAYLTLNF